ncbi:MAG TPA: serine/threonine-protein kinase [Coleofasciculaceae cyanobacterium]
MVPLLRNRYRIIKPIGGGGFGRTFLTEDTDCMNALCVVKQFSPSPQIQTEPEALEKATELFNQEAVRLFELGEHPQIPKLFAHFKEDKQLYLVQEFVDGQTLLAELRQQGVFNEGKIRQLLVDLLPILQFIHQKGVIHRDIKPENIMRRYQDDKLVLIDFGVSKHATETILGQVGTTVGTPGYASLEQMRGQVYPASDLYSVGATCVCLLTQSVPTKSGPDNAYNALEGRWMWRDYLPLGTTISDRLGQILDKLLQNFVKDRYQSAPEVLQALHADELSSSAGIDYRTLRNLLATEKWKEADRETLSIMLKVSNREKEGWLREKDLAKFPCKDLHTIDQLWVRYSNGRFGFSVQKRILHECGKKYQLFSAHVGWRSGELWLSYDGFVFTLKARQGHLPSAASPKVCVVFGASGGCSLFSRIEACQQQEKS